MREDLRYLENLIEDRVYSSHPSDEKLADFIDNRLIGSAKDELVEHLTYCYSCREVVHEVIEHKKKPRIFNNIVMIATPLMAIVASLLIFVYQPPNNNYIGIIDLSQNSIMEFRADEQKKQDKIIDGDKFIKDEIAISTDVTYLETFIQAEEQKNLNKLLNLYQTAINQISKNENISDKDRLKQTIIIRRSMLIRAIREDNKIAIDSYRGLVKEDIRSYYLNYYKEKK